jgi:endonuclease/exonuclease/phosphatase family metal-dependent hydrolase
VADEIRLLCWNLGRVHFGGRVNRWLGLDSRAADEDVPHVARVIAGARADVVAVQELRGEAQLERLRALLGGEWRAAAPSGDTGDRRVGLLARGALGPAFDEVAMVGTGRAAQAAAVGDGGRRWAIASVHFDAYDARARAVQARELAAWARERGEAAVVVAGDLNLDLDLARLMRRREDSLVFQWLARELEDLGAGAGATAIGGRRVDYVLARPGVGGSVRVLRGRRVRLGDHDPLLATLTFPALPTGLARSRR